MAFRNPIVSGVQLVRSAIESGNYVAGVSGWAIYQNGDAEFNGITIRGADVVDSTQLFYDGAPATGNLMASISPVAGTDPYGNDFQMGIVGYDAGGDYIQQANGSNVGWNLHIDSLINDGQIGLFVTGTGPAMQGVVELQPPTSTGNGPPILDLVSESLDSSAAGYIGLLNTDTVRLGPQTTAETILEYLNAGGTDVTGWGVISDQTISRHIHSATYTGTTTSGGTLTFNHGCMFTPTQVYYTLTPTGGATQIQGQSLGAATAGVAFWGPTGVLRASVAVTFDAIFIG